MRNKNKVVDSSASLVSFFDRNGSRREVAVGQTWIDSRFGQRKRVTRIIKSESPTKLGSIDDYRVQLSKSERANSLSRTIQVSVLISLYSLEQDTYDQKFSIGDLVIPKSKGRAHYGHRQIRSIGPTCVVLINPAKPESTGITSVQRKHFHHHWRLATPTDVSECRPIVRNALVTLPSSQTPPFSIGDKVTAKATPAYLTDMRLNTISAISPSHMTLVRDNKPSDVRILEWAHVAAQFKLVTSVVATQAPPQPEVQEPTRAPEVVSLADADRYEWWAKKILSIEKKLESMHTLMWEILSSDRGIATAAE